MSPVLPAVRPIAMHQGRTEADTGHGELGRERRSLGSTASRSRASVLSGEGLPVRVSGRTFDRTFNVTSGETALASIGSRSQGRADDESLQ